MRSNSLVGCFGRRRVVYYVVWEFDLWLAWPCYVWVCMLFAYCDIFCLLWVSIRKSWVHLCWVVQHINMMSEGTSCGFRILLMRGGGEVGEGDIWSIWWWFVVLLHCDIANGVLFIGELYPCCGVCGLIHEHYITESSTNQPVNNRSLLTDELVEVQDFRRITDQFKGKYEICLQLIEKYPQKITSCNGWTRKY